MHPHPIQSHPSIHPSSFLGLKYIIAIFRRKLGLPSSLYIILTLWVFFYFKPFSHDILYLEFLSICILKFSSSNCTVRVDIHFFNFFRAVLLPISDHSFENILDPLFHFHPKKRNVTQGNAICSEMGKALPPS